MVVHLCQSETRKTRQRRSFPKSREKFQSAHFNWILTTIFQNQKMQKWKSAAISAHRHLATVETKINSSRIWGARMTGRKRSIWNLLLSILTRPRKDGWTIRGIEWNCVGWNKKNCFVSLEFTNTVVFTTISFGGNSGHGPTKFFSTELVGLKYALFRWHVGWRFRNSNSEWYCAESAYSCSGDDHLIEQSYGPATLLDSFEISHKLCPFGTSVALSDGEEDVDISTDSKDCDTKGGKGERDSTSSWCNFCRAFLFAVSQTFIPLKCPKSITMSK